MRKYIENNCPKEYHERLIAIHNAKEAFQDSLLILPPGNPELHLLNAASILANGIYDYLTCFGQKQIEVGTRLLRQCKGVIFLQHFDGKAFGALFQNKNATGTIKRKLDLNRGAAVSAWDEIRKLPWEDMAKKLPEQFVKDTTKEYQYIIRHGIKAKNHETKSLALLYSLRIAPIASKITKAC